MINLTIQLKIFSRNRRLFCKKVNTTKKERWFDRHLDSNVNRIIELNFKKIDIDVEIFRLKNEIIKINKEINELKSNKK